MDSPRDAEALAREHGTPLFAYDVLLPHSELECFVAPGRDTLLHRLQQATAATVQAELPSPPSYSAVRALLRILEEKGHVRHVEDGPRYVFVPTVPRERARTSALNERR